MCSSRTFQSRISCSLIIVRRSESDTSSVIGGSVASNSRFARARSIILTSLRPAGKPAPNVSAVSVSTSGLVPVGTTWSGVYGLVCAIESRYIDWHSTSLVSGSGAGCGISSAEPWSASTGAKSTSGGCGFMNGMIGRRKYL